MVPSRLASLSNACFILLPEQTSSCPRARSQTILYHYSSQHQPTPGSKAPLATLSKFYPWGPSLSTMVHTNEPTEPSILPYGCPHLHEKHWQRPFPAPGRMRRLLQVKCEPAKPTRRPQPSAPTMLAGGVKKSAEPRGLHAGKWICEGRWRGGDGGGRAHHDRNLTMRKIL